MSRGQSGRMVVELDPGLKRQLYAALAGDGLTFKDWLIGQAQRYMIERTQPLLFAHESVPPSYGKSSNKGTD